ncbi:MAG: hypothetical protein EAZ91_12195 [Cytophagales bacterium]|nr:MAG: hypothetical protein EAZ91_12195 [Cytophagales bacterium]
MKALTCLLVSLLLGAATYAQNPAATRPDSTPATPSTTSTADDLLAGLTDSTQAEPLLPRHMIFTQRAFWGPKGLLRVMNVAPLTPEARTKELKVRRTMLRMHQVAGFVTLAGFVAQGVVGSRLYKAEGNDYARIKNTHENLATGINIAYTTTALLSLTAPPKAVDERRGLSSIKIHKYLAVLHIAGMIATNVLSHQIGEQRNLDDYLRLKKYHRAAAYTTFGAFAASIIAIKF